MPEAQPQAEPTSLTPAQGEAAIEALLKGPSKGQGRPTRPDQPEEEPDVPGDEEGLEVDEDDAPDEGGDEDHPPVVDKEPEEEENAAEEGEEAQSGDVVEVRLSDTETVEIPLNDLPAHVMMRRDYTQKTQALAEQTKALEEHWAAVQQERQLYAGYLPRIQQMLQQAYPQEPNWEHLLQTNPAEYLVQKHRWEQAQRQYQAAESEQQRLVQLQQLDMIQRLQGHLDHSKKYLVETIPGWKDERRQQADKSALRSFAKESGFTEQEIERAYDPRLVRWGIMAMKYMQLQRKGKPEPTRREDAPAVLRPGRSAGSSNSAPVARLKKAINRVRQTKSPKDGEAAIEMMLNAGRI